MLCGIPSARDSRKGLEFPDLVLDRKFAESPLERAVSLQDMGLSNRNLLSALFGRDMGCFSRNMLSDLVELDFFCGNRGPIIGSGCLAIGPAGRQEAFLMT